LELTSLSDRTWFEAKTLGGEPDDAIIGVPTKKSKGKKPADKKLKKLTTPTGKGRGNSGFSIKRRRQYLTDDSE
jgi:hypothetical protein